MPRSHHVQARVSAEIAAALDALIADSGLTRSQAARVLLDRGAGLSKSDSGLAIREGLFQGQRVLFKCIYIVSRWVQVQGEDAKWDASAMEKLADRLSQLLGVK